MFDDLMRSLTKDPKFIWNLSIFLKTHLIVSRSLKEPQPVIRTFEVHFHNNATRTTWTSVALFWKSNCATCSPACVILYHVTGSCKRPVLCHITFTSNISIYNTSSIFASVTWRLNIQGYSLIFKTALFAIDIWRIMNTTAFNGCKNMLENSSREILCFLKANTFSRATF